MKPTRPMKGELIEEGSFHKLKFPLLASPKLDGFRCLKLEDKALSSSFKPIRNVYTREYIEKHLPNNIDGELMLSNPKANFNEISSALTSYEGEPDFVFYAFDFVSDKPFSERYEDIKQVVYKTDDPRLYVVTHSLINNLEDLLRFENRCLEQGYEGVMVRTLDGPYKSGKATVNQGWLLKIKRFVDSEAEIVDFVEEMTNTNELEKNELGLNSRASKKENLVPANTLGAFKVRDVHTGVELEIGTGRGLTDKVRQEIWNNKDKYKKLLVKYQYQKVGIKEKPRFPSWLGFRPIEDMS